MTLLLFANWEFGITELIGTISATLTLLAICTSLYLAQKSKTLKFKMLGNKVKRNAFLTNQCQQIEILNIGHIKFTCTCVGYQISNQYYFTDFICGLKKYDTPIIEKNSSGSTNHITNTSLLLPTYVQEGDLLQIALFPADFNFYKIKKNHKVYIFAMINGKLYKKYTGMRLRTFKENIRAFDKRSLQNHNPIFSIDGRNIKDCYLR